MKCGLWSVKCEVWTVKCEVWSMDCEVWSVQCEVWSVKCEVWGLECEGSSEKWEVWSVKCGVWSVKFGVRRVQCAVWGVECRWKDTVGTGCLWTIGHLCLGNFRRRLARVYMLYMSEQVVSREFDFSMCIAWVDMPRGTKYQQNTSNYEVEGYSPGTQPIPGGVLWAGDGTIYMGISNQEVTGNNA